MWRTWLHCGPGAGRCRRGFDRVETVLGVRPARVRVRHFEVLAAGGTCHHVLVDPPPRRDEILKRPQELAGTYDEVGTAYEARPGYPAWVFETLVDPCGLRAGASVLEIGPGVGQATVPLLERGARVTAVEPGVALAHRLSERVSGREAEVVVSAFEDFEVVEAVYDLVVSATAFHWVDPVVGLTKCARGLRDRGWLVLWWTIWGDPGRSDPFRDALEPALARQAPHLLEDEASSGAYLRDIDARVAEADRLGSFGRVTREFLRWDGRHDPVELKKLFSTFAGWIALEDGVRSDLLDEVERLARDEFAGTVHRPYLTVLYRTQRLPR